MAKNEPSASLLSAALGGLLALQPACSNGKTTEPGGSDAAVTTVKDATVVDTGSIPLSDGGACDASVVADASITSSQIIDDMTLEKFADLCKKRNGLVQIHPHCGGENGCKGFSYDILVKTLTEHQCRGLNTCTGWSCIICD